MTLPTSAFEAAVASVLKHEGGLSVNRSDPGQITKYGISQRAHPDVDVINLTPEQAREIYRVSYWTAIRGDELPAALALCLFDSAVNQGVSAAVRMLQEALRVDVDGVLGPETLTAARHSGARAVALFMERRLDRYEALVQSRPGLQQFLRGWRLRVLETIWEASKAA